MTTDPKRVILEQPQDLLKLAKQFMAYHGGDATTLANFIHFVARQQGNELKVKPQDLFKQ